MTSPKRETEPDTLSFEAALEELEALIERVESGEIGLEEAIAQYERGAALVKRCRSVLDVAEKRIAELTAAELRSGESEPENGDRAGG
ncbi:MAG: exodeoxyribonuclease VII small subunit [Planctomycetota bacterium]